jgi:hypothetical protein
MVSSIGLRGELFLAAPANATGDGAGHCFRQAIELANRVPSRSSFAP